MLNQGIIDSARLLNARRLSAFNAYSEPTTDRVTAHGKGESKTSNGLVKPSRRLKKAKASLKIPDLEKLVRKKYSNYECFNALLCCGEEKYSRKSQILSALLSYLKFNSACGGSGENKICNFMNQPFIPVIHSIFEGAALIDTVLRNYPINKPHSCKLYKRGLNDTYLIEAEQERYILRIYRCSWRNKEEIGFELELLAFLHKQNQPVAYALLRKDGGFTTEISAPEGVRYAAVFTYAPGCAVNEKLCTNQSYVLGKVLAQIHQELNGFKSSFTRTELNSEYLLNDSLLAIKSVYKYRQPDIDYLEQLIEKVQSQIAVCGIPYKAPEYGICVGDVHSGNAHFTEQNQPTLFDFDQCGYSWRAFDIAKFLHTALRMKIDVGVRNSFIEGYQTIRQLSEDELASIPVFVKAAHIWVMGISTSVVGDVLPYGWFDDDWLDTRLAMLTELAR